MNIFSKEIKLALVGVLAIALLIVGINFLKGVNIFSPTNSYFVRFTDIQGLAVSTPVYANGYAVGNVRSLITTTTAPTMSLSASSSTSQCAFLMARVPNWKAN